MKKLAKYIAVVILVVSLLWGVEFIYTYDPVGGKPLYIYNWGEYIDPDLIDKFEEESGYDVVYETFDSNEAMLTKVQAGSSPYDVVFPSDYMVQKMREDNLLIPLDYNQLDQFKNLDTRFLNQPFDPNNIYSIPYFWGTVGVVYNTTMTDLNFDSWLDLWDPSLKNDVLMVDSAREALGASLDSLGYSINTTSDRELNLAQQNLFDLRSNVKAIIGDEMLQLMPQGEAAAAVTWSGSASSMIDENDDLDYAIPKEGSNIFLDTMVVPKTSKNTKGAYEFINFMLEPENAAQNAEWVGYSTPNKAALDYMDPEVVNDERFYPPKEVTDTCEYYTYLGKDETQVYNDLFLEFKMY